MTTRQLISLRKYRDALGELIDSGRIEFASVVKLRRKGHTVTRNDREQIAAHPSTIAHLKNEHNLVSAAILIEENNARISYSEASLIARTTPANIARLQHTGMLAGNRQDRTVTRWSLEAWMETRNRA